MLLREIEAPLVHNQGCVRGCLQLAHAILAAVSSKISNATGYNALPSKIVHEVHLAKIGDTRSIVHRIVGEDMLSIDLCAAIQDAPCGGHDCYASASP